MDHIVAKIPKVELHAHIEGTILPQTAQKLARIHDVKIAPDVFAEDGKAYRWSSFLDLVTRVYQAVAVCMRTKADYEVVVYDYLARCADEGAVYVELIGYPGQGAVSGIAYNEMVDGIAAGIDRARTDKGIEARVNMALERHNSLEVAEKDASTILSYPHPYIVGLDIAGGERDGDVKQFRKVIDRIRERFGRDLGMRMHAAEWGGPGNARDALDFGVTRIGHGVRIIEDDELMKEIIRRGVILEVCPTSNILAGIYPSYDKHPLRKLYDAGVKISLNSDDPGLFGASLGDEYQVAKDRFGFSADELKGITQTALRGAYIDDNLRARLLAACGF